jgi:hypothetical protein
MPRTKKTKPDVAEAAPALAVTAPPLTDGETQAQAEAREKARLRSQRYREETKKLNAERRAQYAAAHRPNPLDQLPEKDRAKLFSFLRDCPYDDAMKEMARDLGAGEVTSQNLTDFFEAEAEHHWAKRIERAAFEANALIRLVEANPAHYSSGILAALGQEAFRQVASGQAEPEAMNKMATLFLRARADDRADQLGELKREKLRQEMRGEMQLALDKLAEEVSRHPEAREAFENLQRKLSTVEGG